MVTIVFCFPSNGITPGSECVQPSLPGETTWGEIQKPRQDLRVRVRSPSLSLSLLICRSRHRTFNHAQVLI